MAASLRKLYVAVAGHPSLGPFESRVSTSHGDFTKITGFNSMDQAMEEAQRLNRLEDDRERREKASDV